MAFEQFIPFGWPSGKLGYSILGPIVIDCVVNDLVTGCISDTPAKLKGLWLPENSIVYNLDNGYPLLLLKSVRDAVILVSVWDIVVVPLNKPDPK